MELKHLCPPLEAVRYAASLLRVSAPGSRWPVWLYCMAFIHQPITARQFHDRSGSPGAVLGLAGIRQAVHTRPSTCTRVRPLGLTTHNTTNSMSKYDYLQSAMLHMGTMMIVGSYAIIAMRTRGCTSQCRIQPCKTPDSLPQRISHAQLPLL